MEEVKKMPAARAPRRLEPRDKSGPTLTYLVGRLERALRKRLQETLAPFKLSVAQYTTLSVLQTSGEEVSNARLAGRAFISPQAMNEVVQGLEARKLVTRQAASSHGRIVQLLLTESGQDLLAKSHHAVRDLELIMLEGLDGSGRKALQAALMMCAQSLESLGKPARPSSRSARSSGSTARTADR